MQTWPFKDTDEKLDYSLDWAERLDGDIIASSSWEVEGTDTLLVISESPPPSFTDTATTLWLTGGTTNKAYTITNTINTAGGRIMQQSAVMEIRSK